jgi:GTP-binding protein
MIRPVIAIVGRPNVGKSALFNRLIERRQALVRDEPGVTRDRLYGSVAFGNWQATAIDTGGFDPGAKIDLVGAIRRQVLAAIEEADLVFFVVDGRAGLTPLDSEAATVLRRSRRPVFLVVNKVDGAALEPNTGEFHALGFSPVFAVSAEHGRGVAELLEAARSAAPSQAESGATRGLRVAVIGRPNVGKSSLVNAVLGAERLLVHESPGTTRDAVDTPLLFRGKPYVLIDTAGIRRKGRVTQPLEKLAVVMALKGVERCQVAIVMLDAPEGVTAQDAHIAGYAHEAGRAIVIAVNKWDLVPRGAARRAAFVARIRETFPFLDYAPVAFTSAVTCSGLDELFDLVDHVGEEATKRVPPEIATGTVVAAVERRPVTSGGVPLRVRSVSQVGVAPPTFVVRANQIKDLHFSYERYLVNSIRRKFGFSGSRIRLVFRRAKGRSDHVGHRR